MNTTEEITPCITCISYAICKSKYMDVYNRLELTSTLNSKSSILSAYYKMLFMTCPIISNFFKGLLNQTSKELANGNDFVSTYDIMKDKEIRLYQTFIKPEA